MSVVTRPSFGRGWMPDADAAGCPPDALLRMDNGILDELGMVSLRRGAGLLTTLATADAHSLYTAVLNGVRYRLAVAMATVYSNGSSIATNVAGSDNVTFGSMLGQIFFARSTTKKKYDGGTVRNWGLSMTGGAPTVATGAAPMLVLGSGDATESPAFVIDVDDGTGAAFMAGHDGTANGALAVQPAAPGAGLSVAQATKTFGSDQDYTNFGGGVGASDADAFTMWLYISDVGNFVLATLSVDVNSTTPNADFYQVTFRPAALATGADLPFSPVIGWNLLTCTRSQFQRLHPTSGRDWSTVSAFRILTLTVAGGAGNLIAVDNGRFTGAANVSGDALTWVYIYARNADGYIALSAPSAASAAASFGNNTITVTAPADPARDPQVNEIWVYRLIGETFYRTAVKTGISGTASVDIDDTLSNASVLTIDLPLVSDAMTPPDAIIGLAGPHYDRLWALTATTIAPSKQLNPDTFSTGEAITIGGADEVPYWIVKAPGGLYVGTSKDIYRLDGTGNPLPDGTIDIQKTPLGIDHPPISAALANEGANIIYLANDGWRGVDGYSSRSLVSVTSLLYKGQTRHGVSPVNLATGRLRAVLARGQLVAIVPEGSGTTSSSVLYRYVIALDRWYRHVYTVAWRSLAREPDGTLIAGDTDGRVWTLDTETTGDNGSGIAVEFLTRVDDLGDCFRQKDPTDLHLQVENDAAVTTTVYQDSSSTAALIMSVSAAVLRTDIVSLSALAMCRQMQLRLTGMLKTFRLGAIGWNAVPLPIGVLAFDSGPIAVAGREVLWLRALRLQVLGASVLTVTPYIDGQTQAAVIVTPLSGTQAVPVIVWFGRGYKGGVVRFKIESASPFVLYWMEVLHRVSGSLAVDKRIIQVKSA